MKVSNESFEIVSIWSSNHNYWVFVLDLFRWIFFLYFLELSILSLLCYIYCILISVSSSLNSIWLTILSGDISSYCTLIKEALKSVELWPFWTKLSGISSYYSYAYIRDPFGANEFSSNKQSTFWLSRDNSFIYL